MFCDLDEPFHLPLMSCTALFLAFMVPLIMSPASAVASEPGSFEWVQSSFPAYAEKPAIGKDGTIYTRAASFYGLNQKGDIKFDIDDGIMHRVGGGITVRSDGSVLMADPLSGKIYAYSAPGERLWNYDTGGGPEEDWVRGNGGYGHLKHIALAQDGTIYAVTENSTLFALTPQGNLKWKKTLHPNGTIFNSAPVISRNGTVFIGLKSEETVRTTNTTCEVYEVDCREIAGEEKTGMCEFKDCHEETTVKEKISGELYAVNPDGSVKWTFEPNASIRGTASINEDGIIYTISDEGTLYALNKDGSLNWKHTTRKDQRPFTKDPINNYFYGSASLQMAPAIGTNGTIYYGAHDNEFFAVNSDGSRKWVYKVKEEGRIVGYSPAVADDGTVYFGNEAYGNRYAYGHIYALNPNGTLKWKRKVHGRARGAPLIYQGSLIYGIKGSGIPTEDLLSINIEGKSLARSPWPSYQFGLRNTGRAQKLCSLKPSLKLRPNRINVNHGSVTLFITGFEASSTRTSEVKPTSVKLNGAEPEQWVSTPRFLKLKYRRDKLGISVNSRKWTETDLSIEGSLKTSGCFSLNNTVRVRP